MEQEQQWLERFLDITPDIAYFIDLDGNLRQWNKALERLCGLPPERMLGRPCTDFICEQDRPLVEEGVRKVLTDGALEGAYRFVRHDGVPIPFHCNGSIVTGSDGLPAGFFGMGRDISDRQAAEEKAIEQKRFSDDVINNMPGVFYMLDTQGCVVRTNPLLQRISGYSIEESFGRSALEFIAPEEREATAQGIREVFEKGDASMESVLLTRDGRRLPFHFSGHCTIIDGQPYILGIGIDLSERKAAEARTEDLLRLNQAILEKSPAGICVYRASGLCVMVNAAYARAIGGTIEQVRGQDFRRSESWKRNGLLDIADRVLASGETVSRDISGETSFGKSVTLECSFTRLGIAGEDHLLVIVNDISERIAAENALRESMALLEQKERSKSRFLAAAGHDLRQPVAAANLFIDTLKLTIENPRQAEIVRRLEISMGTFKGLLDSLLDISKLDAGIVKPEFVAVDLDRLFDWLKQDFQPRAATKGLVLRRRWPRGELAVHADIALLKSVLMNLVTNAIKYTREGAILLCARHRGSGLLFQVWDTGIGIAPGDIEHIYDEFFQVGNPQRDRAGGLGLGLSIARRAIRLLGSELGCRSLPGRGTVFEFWLPTAEPDGPQEDPGRAGETAFWTGKRFVVVEDDSLVAGGMTMFLEALGGEVECFQNAGQALAAPAVAQADYYVVDYMLGETDGIRFLRSLQERLGRPLRAVVVTGDTSEAFIREAGGCAWPVLHKPIDTAKLIALLRDQ